MTRTKLLGLVALLAAVPAIAACGGTSADVNPLRSSGTAYQVGNGGGADTGITVRGLGEVRVEPDAGLLTVGVEVQARTVAEARAQAAADAESVIQSLLDNGIAEEDIQTVGLSIQPRYEYPRDRQPQLVGYVVSNTVCVIVRDLDRFPEVIDDAAEAGGDATRVSGIQFIVEDRAEAVEQARALAVEHAREAAEQLADAAGVGLGLPVMIVEETAASPAPVFRGEAPAMEFDDARTPVFAGLETVSVTVTIRWTID